MFAYDSLVPRNVDRGEGMPEDLARAFLSSAAIAKTIKRIQQAARDWDEYPADDFLEPLNEGSAFELLRKAAMAREDIAAVKTELLFAADDDGCWFDAVAELSRRVLNSLTHWGADYGFDHCDWLLSDKITTVSSETLRENWSSLREELVSHQLLPDDVENRLNLQAVRAWKRRWEFKRVGPRHPYPPDRSAWPMMAEAASLSGILPTGISVDLPHGDLASVASRNGVGANSDRWITVSDAARVADVNKGTISRAAERGEIQTNRRTDRDLRLDAASFIRWHLARLKRPERRESDESVRRKLSEVGDV